MEETGSVEPREPLPSEAPALRQCSRVGIDVTRRCNFKCKTCFYRYHPQFGTDYDEPLAVVMSKTKKAQARGCDHVVLVGWGEPGLWKPMNEYLKECGAMGLTTSMITNGSLSVETYASFREAGLNHLHVSVHGIGSVLDEIVGVEGAGARQERLLKWLGEERWPWRMNMTVQRINYQTLPDIAAYCIKNGCKHIISLGFLPHYEWSDPVKRAAVAIHPAEIGPYIEAAGEVAIGAGAWFTIRYHPMCLLSERWRLYVVNARYVLYDPWEWDYGHHGEPDAVFWKSANDVGGAVAITEEPCISCGLFVHCGGWNKVQCSGFGTPAEVLHGVAMDKDYIPGLFHVRNPANQQKGWF